MLLCGIIDELKEQAINTAQLIAFFFCQATDGRLNNAIGVLRGLIYLLIDQRPSLITHLQQKHKGVGKALFEGPNTWFALREIFMQMLQDPNLPDTILIIDALDECESDLPLLLSLIIEVSPRFRIKWLVSSRNRTDIEQKLQSDQSRTRLSLELKSNAAHVSHAVDAYIDHYISEIPAIQDDPQLQAQVRQQMQRKADGTFLWVSLVAQELKTAETWHIAEIMDEVPTGLKELYRRMIRQIQHQRRDSKFCIQMLLVVTTTYRPLCLEELGALSGLPQQAFGTVKAVAKIVKLCGSFLTLREGRVFIIHQSAQDFLDETANDVLSSGKIGTAHDSILVQSLDILSKTLRRDIYNLNHYGIEPHHIKPPSPDPLASAGYSCIYWVDHLSECQTDERTQYDYLGDGGPIDIFLRQHFLHWLEAFSIVDREYDLFFVIRKLELLAQVSIVCNFFFGEV